MTNDIIEGKIAKIIDEYSVIINRGLDHGVKEDMRFVIFEDGEEIKDPETDENLGTLEIVKGKVRVVNAQQTLSYAKSDMWSPSISGLANIITSGSVYGSRMPLDIGEKEKKDKKNEKKVIIVGDKVREIPE